MDAIGHEALIYVSAELMGAKERLAAIIESFRVHSNIINISTIYRREHYSTEKLEKDFSVEFVVRIRTRLDVDKLKRELDSIQGFRTHIIMLTFDSVISMVPQLTLPWPSMHNEVLVIRAAAEVHPEYMHPVMNETLKELANQIPIQGHKIEFFMQGKNLCEF